MRYEFTIDIDRPVEQVWDFMNDVFNMPRLRGQSVTYRQTSPGPVGVGTTFEGIAMILGFETRVLGRVTEWDPPRATTSTAVARPVRHMTLRETYEPTETGTRLVRTIDLELQPIVRLLWPLVRPLVLRRWETASRNIKALLEAEPPTG